MKRKEMLFWVGVVLLLGVICAAQAWAQYGWDMYGRPIQRPEPDLRMTAAAQHFVAALFGGLLGAFFSRPFAGFRRWIFLLLLAAGALWAASLHVSIGNTVFFIFGMMAAFIFLNAITAPPYKKPTTFGSAEWADYDHLKKHNVIDKREGFYLGDFVHVYSYNIRYSGDRHLLTVAPTRSGKGVSAIIPNLLTYEGSAIVVDPKGENALITAARRGKGDPQKGIPGLGQTVHVVDPWHITPFPSAHINPLDWLRDSGEDINENAMILADSIIVPHAGSRDQFWDEEAKALLMGILLWVAQGEGEDEGIVFDGTAPENSNGQPERKEAAIQEELTGKSADPQNDYEGMFFDSETLSQNDDEPQEKAALLLDEVAEKDSEQQKVSEPAKRAPQPRTLGRVRELISLGSEELNDLLKDMSLSKNHIISSAAVRTLSKEEKLKSSVLASLQSHTHFLDSPRIRENLSASDFSFDQLKAEKMTIYLVLPADRLETFGRWLRLLIQQAITVNARNIEIKPEKPVLFLLDEMAALGRLTMVEQAYSLMAGFGMQLWGIIQDLSQLHKIYGDGWQTFIGNCGAIQYFGSRDLKTAEYFSKMIGVTTIEKTSISRSIARAFGGGQGSTTATETTNDDVAQRSLAYPDELMVMQNGKEIVFVESCNPIQAYRRPWFQNIYLKTLGVNLQPHQLQAKPEIMPKSKPPSYAEQWQDLKEKIGDKIKSAWAWVNEKGKPVLSKFFFSSPKAKRKKQPSAAVAHDDDKEKADQKVSPKTGHDDKEKEAWIAALDKGNVQTAVQVLEKSGFIVQQLDNGKFFIKSPQGKEQTVFQGFLLAFARGIVLDGTREN